MICSFVPAPAANRSIIPGNSWLHNINSSRCSPLNHSSSSYQPHTTSHLNHSQLNASSLNASDANASFQSPYLNYNRQEIITDAHEMEKYMR